MVVASKILKGASNLKTEVSFKRERLDSFISKAGSVHGGW